MHGSVTSHMSLPLRTRGQLEVIYMAILCTPCVTEEYPRGDVGGENSETQG